jgi:hypothetical protein
MRNLNCYGSEPSIDKCHYDIDDIDDIDDLDKSYRSYHTQTNNAGVLCLRRSEGNN